MKYERENDIKMIPLSDIELVNPRERGRRKHQQIINNIAKLGLKKPITVTPKGGSSDGKYYLVCGQGRLEAYQSLGEEKVPAIVIHVSREKLFLMSLVENLARRQHTTLELVSEIGALKERGYTFSQIAKKIDMEATYVRGIVKLLKQGEERLLNAVERGQIPLNVAITIATSDDHEIQRALTDAYEANELKGQKLINARRLIESRKTSGKKLNGRAPKGSLNGITGKSLLKTYQEETTKQRLLIKKSKLSETRLLFVISSLRQLFSDESFAEILREEDFDTLPSPLHQQIYDQGEAS